MKQMEEKEREYLKILEGLTRETADAILFWILFTKVYEIQFIKVYSKSFNFIQVIRLSSLSAFILQFQYLGWLPSLVVVQRIVPERTLVP